MTTLSLTSLKLKHPENFGAASDGRAESVLRADQGWSFEMAEHGVLVRKGNYGAWLPYENCAVGLFEVPQAKEPKK